MNCKPNELAYIRLPADEPRSFADQINGMIVVTVRRVDSVEPAWEVRPPITITLPRPMRDLNGNVHAPGSVVCFGILDRCLVPIRGDEQPEQTGTPKELEAQ